ncbi:MAG TPA: CheR family methyltransferase [Myxococcales bacterium]|nr:CheR family methyltransferase [Myxococcales bacterium]
MSARPLFDQHALERLTEYAAAWTGFSPDAILPDAIRRAARSLGGTPEELVARAGARDREVVHALCQAVSVGETFFFRHPDQFRWVAGEFVPELLVSNRRDVRVWSAGCATGEETYSIAACLVEAMPPDATIEVLGTDLLERNLKAARAGVYGAWSSRPSAPRLHAVVGEETTSGKMSVSERVRRVTRFELHNLLDGGVKGPFDLILCRNVLVYFSPTAVRSAVAHLVEALAPRGAILFGPMDLPESPNGLALLGSPELQIYRRPVPRAARERPTPPKVIRAPAPPPPRPAPPEPVAMHLRALVHIERGEKVVAERALAELGALVPDYVPGILERALLHVRQGERAAAAELMREVLRRTETLPPDDELPGPEPLPVRFYRESASTFLRGTRSGA